MAAVEETILADFDRKLQDAGVSEVVRAQLLESYKSAKLPSAEVLAEQISSASADS